MFFLRHFTPLTRCERRPSEGCAAMFAQRCDDAHGEGETVQVSRGEQPDAGTVKEGGL